MMRCLRLLIAGLALAFLASPLAAAEGDPEAIVRSIYAQYGEGGVRFDVPEAYFSEELLGLWRAVDEGAEGDVEDALGFAIFTASREAEVIAIDDVRLELLAEKYVIASYVVIVEEQNAIAATKKYFQYNFEKTAGGWKIDNIDWGPDRRTLRDYLIELKALRALK